MADQFNGETWRILECTKPSEYLALSDNNKDFFRIIISAQIVDMTDGSRVRSALLGMFPEGSETGDALRDPANGLTPLPFLPNP